MSGHVIPDPDRTTLYILSVHSISLDHDAVPSRALARKRLASDRQKSLGGNNVAHFQFSRPVKANFFQQPRSAIG